MTTRFDWTKDTVVAGRFILDVYPVRERDRNDWRWYEHWRGRVSITANTDGQSFDETTVRCADRNEAIAAIEAIVESILAPFAAATGR